MSWKNDQMNCNKNLELFNHSICLFPALFMTRMFFYLPFTIYENVNAHLKVQNVGIVNERDYLFSVFFRLCRLTQFDLCRFVIPPSRVSFFENCHSSITKVM